MHNTCVCECAYSNTGEVCACSAVLIATLRTAHMHCVRRYTNWYCMYIHVYTCVSTLAHISTHEGNWCTYHQVAVWVAIVVFSHDMMVCRQICTF